MGGRGFLKVQSDDGWGERGGYMNAKLQKLEEQFTKQSERLGKLSSIFEGVAIHVDGYTSPTADQLKALMAQHGGRYHAYYSSTGTTHIIATNLPRAKTKDLRPNQKIVRPEWVVDCIKEGKQLPIQPYIVAARGVSRMQTTLTGMSNNSIFVKESRLISTDRSMSETQTFPDDGNSSTRETPPPYAPSTSKKMETMSSSRTIVSTTDSTFLSDFYSHSRLHFLSTWRTELADYVRSLSNENANLAGFNELRKIATTTPGPGCSTTRGKYIVHIDMDCFFVSVGLLSRPHLAGLPVAVTHHSANAPATFQQRPGTDPEFEMNYYHQKLDKKKRETECQEKLPKDTGSKTAANTVSSYSEIASCNYEARRVGLKNGMFYGKAIELCPDLVAIPYDFGAYRQASQKLYTVLTSYTKSIEAVSCDEALLDITHLVADTGLSPSTIVQHIRQKIKDETGCNASAGIAPSISIARMATRVGKPNGLHEVKSNQVDFFIHDQKVKDLPGVGRSTASRLQELGVKTCGDLKLISLSILKKEFGVKNGQKLYDLCRGVDKREVCQSKERKSVSADVNYGIRLTTEEEMKTFLGNLAKEVSDRLKKAQMVGKKVTLKIMVRLPNAPVETAKYGGHGVCQSLSKCKSLDFFTDDCDVIKREAIILMKSLQTNIPDLRGIGIQLTQLQSAAAKIDVHKSAIGKFMKPKEEDSKTKLVKAEDCIIIDSDDEVPNVNNCESNQGLDSSVQTNKGISTSFLDALPDDIRQEVEKDIKGQQLALQGTRVPEDVINVETSNDVVGKSSKSKSGRTSGNVARTMGNQSKNVAAHKKSPSKRKRPTKTLKGSPNKLITEMFSVIKKPPGKFSDNLGPMTSSPIPAHTEAKRRSNSRVVLEEKFQELDSASPEPPTATDVAARSPPSLGGATTVKESRDIIRKWTEAHGESPPLESDILDVAGYLRRLVTESRDLEGVHLLVRTLRRSIINVMENCDIMGTFIENDGVVTSWISAYEQITSSLQDVVKANYTGVALDIEDIA
ncbi:DNA repair protein REV1-like isoform X2 [Clavelina lepadiformis]|uniref:DNA repair protein REV1-like isoform X2 n=1 Tax=Clavelina lepadiformis TaxID=159417 RepID=UPI0040429A2D